MQPFPSSQTCASAVPALLQVNAADLLDVAAEINANCAAVAGRNSLLFLHPSLFQRRYLCQSAAMALFTGKARAHERTHEVKHQLRPDYARAQAENVHFVVLYSLVCGVDVVAHAGTNAPTLVGGNRHPDATAANQQSALAAAAYYFLCDRRRVVRVIVRLRRIMRAKIDDLVPQPAQFGDRGLVQRYAGMIRSHGNAHNYLICGAEGQ
jgi:hypothetical protein